MRVIRGQMPPKNKAYGQRQGYTEPYAGTYAGYADGGHEGHRRLNQQPPIEIMQPDIRLDYSEKRHAVPLSSVYGCRVSSIGTT